MKTILITGASRGIGRALAKKFLAAGDFVVGTSRNGTADFEHENFVMFPLELTDEKSRTACIEHVLKLNKKN